jgi:hypothetical protein
MSKLHSSLFDPSNHNRTVQDKKQPVSKNGASRFKPLLLSHFFGQKPIQPPPNSLQPPKQLIGLGKLKPQFDANGHPLPKDYSSLGVIEAVNPVMSRRDQRSAPHWDGTQWHSGLARGLVKNNAWIWLYRDSSHWWSVGDDASHPIVRHAGIWWLKNDRHYL